mgnify:FL=1
MDNTPAKLYTMLNVSDITNIVNDISPYVRDREDSFPAVVYEVPNEQFDRTSTGYNRALADAEVTVKTRSAQQGEDIASVVFDTLAAESCVVIHSISREYDQSYDGSSAGIYSVRLSIQISQGV